MLRHDDVAEDQEAVAGLGACERIFEYGFGCGGLEIGLSVVTTEGDEVGVSFFLISDEALGHGLRINRP